MPNFPRIPLFDGLQENERAAVLALAPRRRYADADVIVAEGDPGRGLYILAEGRAVVEKATIAGVSEVLTELTAGECFGELALVDSRPRSATVRARGNADVFVFEQEALDGFFAANPDVQRRILKNLVLISAGRLRMVDESLVQSAYDSVIVIDGQCRILERKKVTDKVGLIEDVPGDGAIVGRDLFEVLPDLGAGIRRQFLGAMAAGRRDVLTLEHARGEDTFYFEVTLAPEAPDRAALGIRNVTEAKSLENRLIQSEKLAMTGQMASEIGHELRNHLTVLIGHVDLLSMVPDVASNEQAMRSVGIVSSQLHKIERFASGLMELGTLRLKKEPSDMNELVLKLVRFIQGQSRFQRCTFEMDLDDALPSVSADPGQIHQVLLNLYANAVDASSSCTITTRTVYDAKARRVLVAVRDTGPGMPAEVADRIFESGFTTKQEGHGHGLAICRRIIENHGGSIAVRTAPGEGATLTLTFKV